MSELNLRQIVTEEFQQEIQDAFAFATGFGVVFTDRVGKHIGSGSNFTRFCNAINDTPYGASCCTLSNKRAIALALESGKPSIYTCHAGMINIEIPIIFQGDYVGAITAGQVLCSEPDYYPTDSIYSRVNWLEDDTLRGYFSEIKTLTRQQIEATTSALASITNYIVQTHAYNQMQQDFSENREKLLLAQTEQIQLQHQLKRAQLDVLQKQVTPHFIFNVINSVARLVALKEYDVAEETLHAFAQMMRYTLSHTQSQVSLDQELRYIRSYLSIQKIRFGERISWEIDCDPSLLNIQIPFLCLQPLVENSIEHGLLSLPSGGTLSLSCRQEGGICRIVLRDNGAGMDRKMLDYLRNVLLSSASVDDSHVGLHNSYNRLRLLFAQQLHFSVDSAPGEGSCLEITFPLT